MAKKPCRVCHQVLPATAFQEKHNGTRTLTCVPYLAEQRPYQQGVSTGLSANPSRAKSQAQTRVPRTAQTRELSVSAAVLRQQYKAAGGTETRLLPAEPREGTRTETALLRHEPSPGDRAEAALLLGEQRHSARAQAALLS
jgi:hypothetical protein